MEKKRDYYIDFLRGIAVISVIIIHTAFKSGRTYVPVFVQSITLLLDVPFFFFLAGWSYSYVNSSVKNIKGLVSIQKKYLFFLLIYTIILIIFKKEDFSQLNFIYNFFYLNTIESELLPVVMGSIWFMPVYFSVSVIFSILIEVINKKNEKQLYIILLFICLIGFMYTQLGANFFNLSQNTLFYGFFYVLGFLSKEYRLKSFQSLSVILIFIAVIVIKLKLIFNVNILVIQNLKFPSHIIYLLLSLITISISLYIKGKVKIKTNNYIAKMGKNAIFYYFGQGISSSILYFFVDMIHYNWVLKFSILICLNILFAILISESIRKIYTVVDNVCNLFWNKYNKKIVNFFIINE